MLVAALAVAVLAGCSPVSVADDSYPGSPAGAPPSDGVIGEGGPIVSWLDEGETFAVTTFGSSSCPPVATSIDQTEGTAVVIHFESASASACTADMGPTTHEFTMPEPTAARPVAVTLTWAESDDSTALSLE
jgi:hypothetical protein